MPNNSPEFEALLFDQEAGAATLLFKYIQILENLLGSDKNLTPSGQTGILDTFYTKLVKAHPLMAIFPNLHKFLDKGLSEGKRSTFDLLGEFKGRMNQNIEETVSKAISIFGDKNMIFTFSHSSIVRKTLLGIHKFNPSLEVVLTETRPVREGVNLAKVLAMSGMKVHLFTDAAMERAVDMSDLILVGTDWY